VYSVGIARLIGISVALTFTYVELGEIGRWVARTRVARTWVAGTRISAWGR